MRAWRLPWVECLQPFCFRYFVVNPLDHGQYFCTDKRGRSVDHLSGVSSPNSDPVFFHVRAGMTVIVGDSSDWRMADVIWVDGGASNTKAHTLFQVEGVDKGVIKWVHVDLVTHIVPRV